ncbi:restriction endonuclease subunit S [Vibrio cincinnatiensis]|uniref:restriction endonuclease subunit S n=1 Tax=Vibrio cincinnatiensis TaxID=675 RepID=UPI001EDE093D
MADYVEKGVPFFRSKEVIERYKGNAITTELYITEEHYQTIKDKFGAPEEGHILLTSVGTLGIPYQVQANDKFYFKDGNLTWFKEFGDAIDAEFLFYWLTSPIAKRKFDEITIGSTQKALTIVALKGIEIDLPPKTIQKQVVKIVKSLDRKLSNNRGVNQTLEQMAQAIFKSWFVDFDPVKAKMNGEQPEGMDAATASLFPEKLVESELGLIPEGWEVIDLPNGTIFREGPGILAKDFHEEGIPLIRLAGLKNGVSLLDGCNYLAPEKVEKKWKHFLLQEGDILLSSSASLGRVAEVTKQSENSIAYTGIIGFRPIEGVTTRKYLKYFIQSPNFQRQIEAFGVGSVLKHFGPTHLKKMWILIPTATIQERFEQLVLALDEKMQSGLEQNQSLANLRDTLLPKLLSGEIELSAEL